MLAGVAGLDLAMIREVVKSFEEIRKQTRQVKVYEPSIAEKNGCVFFIIRENLERMLVILVSSTKRNHGSRFVANETGEFEAGGRAFEYLVCPCSHQNASELRKSFPFTRPKAIGLTPALGTGDRIGLATPGHIRAAEELGVFPILAQQSIREMHRTSRTPEEV
ncbi:MAG: tagaturonate epimerase family protein, partial [Candidatus Bathyarchaeota archaeon]|nr:tagaturonate epimerase family protein [Candidatus Bathyarchaeota archaeon]